MNRSKALQEYFEDVAKNEIPSLLQSVKRSMDFELFGFRQTFLGVFKNFLPGVIFDSDLCRVRLLWHPSDPRDGDYKKITFLYGRLHAPDDEKVIMWEGEKCHCWHRIELALNFLDGLSPEELIGKTETPQIMKRFYQPDTIKTLGLEHIPSNDIQPVAMAMMHASIWKQYGQDLFILFDLRQPELWKKYKFFVKEYYRLNPRIIKIFPPHDSIC